MSLSSRERFIAVMGSGRVGLCRCAGKETEWLGSSGCDTEQTPTWSDMLAVLERMLLERGRPGADLQVLLSSSHARLFLVPWREQISSPAELQMYAHICFDDIYGSQTEEWSIRLSPEGEGMPRLACAIPQAQERSLRSAAQACSFKLVSVQPYLMAAFNCFRANLSEKNYLFVLTEPGRMTALLVRDEKWAAVRTLSHTTDSRALSQLIERERELQQLGGEPVQTIYVHAPGQDEFALDMPVQPRWLSLSLPRLAQRDLLYVMAQAVV